MTTISNSNTACCTIPPVQSSYEPKGTMQPFEAFQKAYITGPEDTGRTVVCVFDIFGFYPQTKQGADILAQTLKARIIMPDLFEPDSAYPAENYPPDTEEKRAAFQRFFAGTANIEITVAKVLKLGHTLKAGGVAQLGVYGFCWGGKVTTLVGAESTYDAVAAIHPAMLNAGDADKLTVPLGLFPSKDEPLDEYEKLVKAISAKPFASKNGYKVYSTMHHGWAAARGNLDDPENKKQYEDLYGTLAGFFKGVWG